jgi:dipeptidyl aminopeptidase/acylaminoacyl peptidase
MKFLFPFTSSTRKFGSLFLYFQLITVLFAGSIHGQSGQVKRNLEIDDFFKFRSLGDPRISPDGEWVAYTVTERDLKKDESETSIRMIAASGGEEIRMTGKGNSASRPRWSPDGKYLAFQASRGESKSQVWTLDLRGGEAQQLTEIKQGISGFEWSPDGSKILLTIRDPKPEDLLDEKEKKDKKPEPWVIDRLQFKRDNIGYLDRRRTHLYVFDVSTKKVKQITSGDYDDSQGTWSPDGKLVAFVSNRTEEPDGNSNSDIWIVSADNSDQGKTLLQVTDNPGSDSQPSWSPDGDLLCYVTVTEPKLLWYATNHLAIISSKGGSPQIMTKSLDRNVSRPRFSSDGNSVIFLLEDSAEVHLARIETATGELERTVSGNQSVGQFDFNQQNKLVFLNSEPQLFEEVFSFSDNKIQQLTQVNTDLERQLNLSMVENIHFPSKDGTEIEGFLFLPPDYNEKLTYPTLLRIHGGPVAQFDFGFNFDAQLFASKGYVVVLVNPRGSSGYGQEFSMGIYQSWGKKDFEDVMAGVDYAIEKGYSDADRLGVGGWSYGGILTNYVITQTGRFKGAITGASEVLYVANYGHDHYQLQWETELGLPWENRDLWEKLSPFNYVENVTTPTLIMCGEKDWNVPVLNSEQLYQALRRLGKTTELVVYPGEHHGIRTPTFIKDRYERYLSWYDKYVKGENSGDSSQESGVGS